MRATPGGATRISRRTSVCVNAASWQKATTKDALKAASGKLVVELAGRARSRAARRARRGSNDPALPVVKSACMVDVPVRGPLDTSLGPGDRIAHGRACAGVGETP